MMRHYGFLVMSIILLRIDFFLSMWLMYHSDLENNIPVTGIK